MNKTLIKIISFAISCNSTFYMKISQKILDNKDQKRESWEKGLSEYQESSTVDQLKFIFEQAEKQLKDSVEDSNTIVTRATTLLTLMSGFLLLILGFLISKLKPDNFQIFHKLTFIDLIKLHPIPITALAIAIYLFWVIYGVSRNLIDTTYYTIGSESKDLFASGYYNNTATDTERLLMFYIGEIKDYQKRIDNNKFLNDIRWRKLNKSIQRSVFTFPLAFIFYLLISVPTFF